VGVIQQDIAMDSMRLKDLRPGHLDFDEGDDALEDNDNPIPATAYHQEINTLEINKLSNRVTIISIIIPCLIIAILVFAYLDIKERVIDVDLTKQSQVEKIALQLEEKVNALDVRIAKNTYDLDTALPELTQKDVSLEGRITKFADAKADTKSVTDQFTKIEKRIADNASQNKNILKAMENSNKQTLSSLAETRAQFDQAAAKIKNEITLFKEEFDARLLELSDYELQIGELRKDFSLLDKKQRRLEQESISQLSLEERAKQLETNFNTLMKNMDVRIETLDKKLNTNMSRLQKDLDRLSSTPVSTGSKPKPHINIDSSGSVIIEEKPLTE
jgi:predicted  nucleic acid-binding Zn-ribbon protein